MQADDGRVHEPGEDAGAGGGGGELQAAVDLPAGPDAGRVGGGRRVHGGEAQGRERRDAAHAAQFPPLIMTTRETLLSGRPCTSRALVVLLRVTHGHAARASVVSVSYRVKCIVSVSSRYVLCPCLCCNKPRSASSRTAGGVQCYVWSVL